jgi:ABC-type lipoprotein release transport system permease subunit
MLYETSARDPLVYVMAALVLVLAATVASIVPARRSASVDPVQAIRAE